jgi:hypothetical protein
VIVFHVPSGTWPINLTPRGALPLRRTMLVLTAVSSINTNLAIDRPLVGRDLMQRQIAHLRAGEPAWPHGIADRLI